MDHFIEINNNS